MSGKVVKVNNQNVAIKDFNGQRVVTFKDIDTVHERADGTARKRFNDNKNHFVEGEDFFVFSVVSEDYCADTVDLSFAGLFCG